MGIMKVLEFYRAKRIKLKISEKITSTLMNQKTFNILVPFVPDGEYLGVMYMKITPDFSFLTEEVNSNFDKVALIYTTLIIIGLTAIFMVSSHAVKERNEAQQKLFKRRREYEKTN